MGAPPCRAGTLSPPGGRGQCRGAWGRGQAAAWGLGVDHKCAGVGSMVGMGGTRSGARAATTRGEGWASKAKAPPPPASPVPLRDTRGSAACPARVGAACAARGGAARRGERGGGFASHPNFCARCPGSPTPALCPVDHISPWLLLDAAGTRAARAAHPTSTRPQAGGMPKGRGGGPCTRHLAPWCTAGI